LEQQAAVIDFPTFTQYRQERSRRVAEYKFKNMEELVTFLAGEINASDLNYTRLAERSHVCASTVSNLANDLTKSPRAATVFAILAALGFEVVVRK
jgi:transcriptional regulator with XRE-family HTH domain